MPCIHMSVSTRRCAQNANPLYGALKRIDMAIQLANISGALERAAEAITEAQTGIFSSAGQLGRNEPQSTLKPTSRNQR